MCTELIQIAITWPMVGMGAVAAVVLGGPVVGWFVSDFDLSDISGMENAGATIGYLERWLVFVFIMAGIPSGVGFLITAKSILRFNEMPSGEDEGKRARAEYVIIGTLASFAHAVTFSYLTRRALAFVEQYRLAARLCG